MGAALRPPPPREVRRLALALGVEPVGRVARGQAAVHRGGEVAEVGREAENVGPLGQLDVRQVDLLRRLRLLVDGDALVYVDLLHALLAHLVELRAARAAPAADAR